MARKSISNNHNVIYVLFCIVLGQLLGWVAYDFIGYGVMDAIFRNVGIWVFTGSLVGYFSSTAARAAVNTLILYICAIESFSIHTVIYDDQLNVGFLTKWVVLAIIGVIIGLITWFAQKGEWIGGITAAVPISVLIAEGYPIYQTQSISLAFDIVCAVLLYLIIAREKYQRVLVIPCIFIFVFAIVYFNVLSRIAGGII